MECIFHAFFYAIMLDRQTHQPTDHPNHHFSFICFTVHRMNLMYLRNLNPSYKIKIWQCLRERTAACWRRLTLTSRKWRPSNRPGNGGRRTGLVMEAVEQPRLWRPSNKPGNGGRRTGLVMEAVEQKRLWRPSNRPGNRGRPTGQVMEAVLQAR